MNKSKRSLIMTIAAVAVLSMGIGAAGTATIIKAELNKTVAISVNGKAFQPTGSSGTKLYPLTYNGVNYVPVNDFAKALGASVTTKGTAVTVTGAKTAQTGTTPGTIKGKVATVEYDKNKQSTWIKFSNIKFSTKTSGSMTYYLVAMDVTNRTSSTVEVSTAGDVGLMDKDDRSLSTVIGISESTKCTLKPGETATIYKGFSATSLDSLAYIRYYPLSAPRGDSAKVYTVD